VEYQEFVAVSKHTPGILITFEGIDFSGKSSQLQLLADYLQARGCETLVLREPGGTRISEQIREILLDNRNGMMAAETELLLYGSARAQVVAEKIIPWLDQGGVVLCDRFYDSTTAYQGYGRGLDLHFIEELNTFIISGRKPDLTILIDIAPDLASGRQHARSGLDRMENQKTEFHNRVRNGYLKLAEMEPERFLKLDGNQSIKTIHNQIVAYTHSKFQF
jgi:dTMP kinase